RQVLHLIEGLDARGVDNVLVCTAGSAIAAEAAGRCRVIELPLAGDVDPWAVRRLRRALSAVRPDIVHVHSRRGSDLYAGLAASGAPWRTVLSRRVDQREVAPWARIKYRPDAAIVAISRAVERKAPRTVGRGRAAGHDLDRANQCGRKDVDVRRASLVGRHHSGVQLLRDGAAGFERRKLVRRDDRYRNRRGHA